jgi:hypothetical protein
LTYLPEAHTGFQTTSPSASVHAAPRKTRHKGTDRVGWMFIFTAAVYNLVRIRNLQEAPT